MLQINLDVFLTNQKCVFMTDQDLQLQDLAPSLLPHSHKGCHTRQIMDEVDEALCNMWASGQTHNQIAKWLEVKTGRVWSRVHVQKRLSTALKHSGNERASKYIVRQETCNQVEILLKKWIQIAVDSDEIPEAKVATERCEKLLGIKVKLLGLDQEVKRVEIKNTSDSKDWVADLNKSLKRRQEGNRSVQVVVHMVDKKKGDGTTEYVADPDAEPMPIPPSD